MPVEIRELVIRATVITVSDACSRGERKDTSGELLVQLLRDIGAEIVATQLLSDDLEPLAAALLDCAERSDVNLIVTTGGTGFAPRDNTPEATLKVIEREAPGLAEAMRLVSPLGRLSRGIAGVRAQAIICNTPGSPKGCVEQLGAILDIVPHAVRLLEESPTEH